MGIKFLFCHSTEQYETVTPASLAKSPVEYFSDMFHTSFNIVNTSLSETPLLYQMT